MDKSMNISSIKDERGRWLFIAPLSGVEFTSVLRKINIRGVIICTSNEVERIIGKYTINKNVHAIGSLKAILNKSNVFAITYRSNIDEVKHNECLQAIRDALLILSISQIGYMSRRIMKHPSLLGEQYSINAEYFMFNIDTLNAKYRDKGVRFDDNLQLDTHWLEFQKKVFFWKMLKVINKEIKQSYKWSDIFYRVCICLGKSIDSSDTTGKLLWSTIALETIIKDRGEKYSEAVPDVLEALLGWTENWKNDQYRERILQIYKKRSYLVHDGLMSGISDGDIEFIDNLIINIIINVLKHPKTFDSRKSLIEFSRKIQAERLLGLKSKIQPRNLVFLRRRSDHYDG